SIYRSSNLLVPEISSVVPIYNQIGELEGVLGSELTLKKIGIFLSSLKIGLSGQAFIMESSGELIASSTADPLVDDLNQKILAKNSSNSLIRSTASYLSNKWPDLQQIKNSQNFKFRLQGEQFLVQIKPLSLDSGLDFWIVIIIPESDFMADIETNSRNSILLCIAALLVTTILGIMTSQWITSPIISLNEIGVAQRTDQLKAAKEKAEIASRAKSEFLSSMSHELRTPLNSILGYTQILRRNSSLTAHQDRALKIIYQSGNHLLTLIEDILDIAKIEARKLELYLIDIHLDEFLAEVISIVQMQAQGKDVLFSYEALSNLPLVIQADEKRLRQVLLNLLGNAVKFTDLGSVTLLVSSLQPAYEEEDLLKQTLRFEVRDTGIGMNSQQLAKIFQPFEQVGDIERRAAGTGLGLTITKQLVELMGSQLQVSSELGKGSTFWFDVTFPLVEMVMAREPMTTAGKIVGYQGSRRRILVVDDREENRLLLENILEPLGFEITQGQDGQQLIELARKIQPDCILTDLVMPVKTGLEAVQEIRRIPDIQDVMIIAISASVLEQDRQQSRIAGCDAFFPKPVEEQSLLALLQKHLQLSWIYEDQQESEVCQLNTEQKATETLMVPPPEEIAILYELAMLGSMKKIRERAIYLKQLDIKYAPLAAKLQELAQGFQEKAIVNLIEKYL
ncbi:MAG: ATP-binding protein, partial [Xenococcus sp. (in: cyanobacteria)]